MSLAEKQRILSEQGRSRLVDLQTDVDFENRLVLMVDEAREAYPILVHHTPTILAEIMGASLAGKLFEWVMEHGPEQKYIKRIEEQLNKLKELRELKELEQIVDETPLQKLEKATAEFEALQEKYAKSGASDTEPDTEFQIVLLKAYEGEDHLPKDWWLYDAADEDKVTAMLNAKAKEISALIRDMDKSLELLKYLKDYCWRLSFFCLIFSIIIDL